MSRAPTAYVPDTSEPGQQRADTARHFNNWLHGQECPPVVCRPLKPGELQPFEWWDGIAGRWCRGDAVPATILGKLPQAERDRYEAHRWRWLGMQADEVHPCP